MVNVLEKMLKQQDTVFYSRYFVDEYNILCYHINGLFFMHGLPRSKVFCSGYAVPGATFRRRPFINRKQSFETIDLENIERHQKPGMDFWCLFLLSKNEM